MESKQRRWQQRQIEKGLCIKCSKPAVNGGRYCARHQAYERVRNRNRYRKAKGIPLDAPLSTRGRPRTEIDK